MLEPNLLQLVPQSFAKLKLNSIRGDVVIKTLMIRMMKTAAIGIRLFYPEPSRGTRSSLFPSTSKNLTFLKNDYTKLCTKVKYGYELRPPTSSMHSPVWAIEYSPFKKLLLRSKKALKTEPFGGMPKRFAQTMFFGGICRQNLRFRRLFGISSLERNGEQGGGAAPGHDDDVTDLTRAALLAPCPGRQRCL